MRLAATWQQKIKDKRKVIRRGKSTHIHTHTHKTERDNQRDCN